MYLFKDPHYSCLFDNTKQKASTLPRYCVRSMSDLPRDRHFHSKPQVLLKVPVKMKGGRSKSHLLQLLPCVSFPWCVRGGPGWFVHRPRHPPTGSRAQPELTSGLGLPNQLRHSLKITESYLALTVMGMYSFLCCLVQRRVPRRQSSLFWCVFAARIRAL